jgi:putative transposase
MSRFIDLHRDRFGVEPICRVLQIAPSSYYAARSRPASPRQLEDERLATEIQRIHASHFGVYGVRKVWHQLTRDGRAAGRDRVARLMTALVWPGSVEADPCARPSPRGAR